MLGFTDFSYFTPVSHKKDSFGKLLKLWLNSTGLSDKYANSLQFGRGIPVCKSPDKPGFLSEKNLGEDIRMLFLKQLAIVSVVFYCFFLENFRGQKSL